jgi:hypothetical protein
VSQALVGSKVVEVGKMSENEAIELLCKSLIKNNRDHATAIRELVDKLDYLPLAIVQAAAYINTNKISVVRYLELIKNTDADHIEIMSREFLDSSRYREVADAVATTCVVSFNQIIEEEGGS